MRGFPVAGVEPAKQLSCGWQVPVNRDVKEV